MYCYVRNSPLVHTDPTGLDFYLRTKEKDSDTAQGGYVGTTTTDANGNKVFTRTVVTSASLQDPKSGVNGTVAEGGVKITTDSGTYAGEFIDGTSSAKLEGSGALSQFTFTITEKGAGSLAKGTFEFHGSPADAANTMSAKGGWSYALDSINPFHTNAWQYRFSDTSDPSGPSSHLSLPVKSQSKLGPGYGVGVEWVPSSSQGEFHVDAHGTLVKHLFKDVWDAVNQF
jgi:hypothetical protein